MNPRICWLRWRATTLPPRRVVCTLLFAVCLMSTYALRPVSATTLSRDPGVNVAGSFQPGTGESAPTAAAAPAESLAETALKIAVRETGMVRVTYDDLVAAGLDPAHADPRRLTLTNRGRAVAMVVLGEEDGTLDAGDAIFFYGTGIERDSPDAPYTVENIYWLKAGAEPGLRMSRRAATPTAALPVPVSFPAQVHAEVDSFYWRTMPRGAPGARWFWGGLLSPAGGAAARIYTVTLTAPSTTVTPAQLRVRLRGYTIGAHRTALRVNELPVGERSWGGQSAFDLEAAVPHGALRSGPNIVTVQALSAADGPDQVLVDWLEVDYQATYRAAGDLLEFGAGASGRQTFQVDGFSTAAVDVYDVTNPALPVRVAGHVTTASAAGYALRFTDEAGAASRYVALGTDRYLAPVQIERDVPSALRAPAEGADYIVVTHADFYDAAAALAAHRHNQGLRTAPVRVEDIFDEFNDGIFNPNALRDFLTYAFAHWPGPAPTYVVLLGDAFQDYRNGLKLGIENYVPSLLYETQEFGEVSSDSGFATIAGGDLLPDLQIGRLPVRSAAEAQAVVDKLIAYDAADLQPWNRRAVLVTDDEEPSFGRLTARLAARLPFDFAVTRIAAGDYPPGDPTAAIARAVGEGAALLNYVGHGEYYRWGTWRDGVLLQTADVGRWENGGRIPVVTVANCLNGFFAGPQASLAETLLLQPGGGAAAVWAPGSVGYPAGHALLLDAFYAAVFRDGERGLGAAVAAAQRAVLADGTTWQELVATYNLLGDPATPLRIPPTLPAVATALPAPGATDVPIDEPIVITFSKRMNPAEFSPSDSAGTVYRPTWNADQTQVLLEHANFVHNIRVQIALAGRDAQGNLLVPGSQPIAWTFSVTADTEPPTVILDVEHGGAAFPGALLRRTLVFSEPVRRSSVALDLTPDPRHGTAQTEPAVALAWEDQDRRAVLELPDLAAGVVYTVTVRAAADRAGNRLAVPVSFPLAPGAVRVVFLPVVVK
jgi:hypothetical protein